MYAIYDNIYHQYTPNVSIYTIHGSYGISHIDPYGTRWSLDLELWDRSMSSCSPSVVASELFREPIWVWVNTYHF